MEENQSFEYTYSAKEQKELESIKKKYMPAAENTLEKVKRLDREAERPGTAVSILLGVAGCLILGAGMSMTMVWTSSLMIPGIVLGIVGIGIMGLAYPAYVRITKKQREKIAPEILALTKEI